jgi:hypothetical protein
VGLDRLNAPVGVRLCRVCLTGGDDLAVRGFEVEAELARLVVADLEFRSQVRPGRGYLTD